MKNNKLTEQQVKDALGINDFRNMTKEKTIELASMFPDLDKEVALKIIEQFPDFVNFLTTIVKHYETLCKSILDTNKESSGEAFKAYNKLLEEFLEQLRSGNISQEDKRYLTEKAIEMADKISQKDTENKNFWLNLFKEFSAIGTKALAGAFIMFGGKLIRCKLNKN